MLDKEDKRVISDRMQERILDIANADTSSGGAALVTKKLLLRMLDVTRREIIWLEDQAFGEDES